ncbi:MAG: MoaD/ThiS family protein [Chloroflexota bacterium]
MSDELIHNVWIPPLYRDLTNGQEIVQMSGTTVGKVIQGLEERYPGIEERLCDEGRVRPGIAVSINGEITPRGLRQKLTEATEIHFVPALGGG